MNTEKPCWIKQRSNIKEREAFKKTAESKGLTMSSMILKYMRRMAKQAGYLEK